MAAPQSYQRSNDGIRLGIGGIDTVHPLDALPQNRFSYLQNVRGYRQFQTVGRATVGDPVVSALPNPVHSLRLLNDETPSGPPNGYVRIIGAGGSIYVDSTQVATGLSVNPFSIMPFRPNTSVQPWAYTADSSDLVPINTRYLTTGASTVFPSTGSNKIRSDGLIFKTGVKEPQVSPNVSTQDYTTTGEDALPATTIPWTNVSGANSDYNYGQTDSSDGTDPVIITGGGPFLVAGATVTLTVTGTANVNGATGVGPATPGPTSGGYPGSATGISGTPSIIIGAFTDASGNVIPPGGSLPLVFFIGAGTTVTVPQNAQQLQIGINSQGNNFHSNSGSFTVNWSVTVSAVATVISTVGQVTAYVWGTPPPAGGGSPHSGPVASYIWKNPNDIGSGTPRSITDPIPDASPSSNSWVFDSTPEDGTVPVNWDVLNPDGSVSGTIPLFDPQLETEGYQDFNCCIVGSLFVPAAGTYPISLQYKDQIMFGVGGGASVGSGTITGQFGQTMTVVNSLPLLFVSTPDGEGSHHTTVVNVTFPGVGVYQVEIDWDYWSHTGRSLIMTIPSTSPNSPTIPPLPANVRTNVQYRYVYRSSATGALSNPSPESPQQATPVLANEILSQWSPDPQIDKVDYYRLDEGLDSFTYVATGPNDALGPLTNGIQYNTPIEDELADLDVTSNQLLEFDNYEPFPVIDLPRKGTVNVTGGTITWVSGDKFNIRWLPGTDILIGSPTSLAYTFISRPYPDGFTAGGTYTIGEIILDPANHYQQVLVGGVAGGVPAWNDSGGTTGTGEVAFLDMGTIFNSNGYVTKIDLPGVPDGTNIVYEIPEPDLAAQPLPYVWGPTDNTAYYFGVGDKLNPGTLYFCKGNFPDSAPQTNQIPVTSPDEPLMNGVKTASNAMVWTPERRWLIYPTYTSALATTEGVEGSVFSVVPAAGSRGLYIPTCVTTDYGLRAFFRAKDGIYECSFGGEDKYLCPDIYNLFPREGFVPQPIVVGGVPIYPPDDTRPSAQTLAYAPGYLYYDYEDASGTPKTLVFGEIEGGWIIDQGQFPFTRHAWEEGPDTNAVMVGCADGTVRLLGNGNAETCTSIVMTGSQNNGDARAFKRLGDIFIKALAMSGNPIAVGLYADRYATTLSGFSPSSLTGTGTLAPYDVSFTDGDGDDLIDIGVSLSWPTASGNVLDLYQPSFISLPETSTSRPTDWSDGGYIGAKFVQGVILERNSFGQNKTFQIQSSDDMSLHNPNELPANFNGQSVKAFSVDPFIAHDLRIVSSDSVPWSEWTTQYVFQPYPELAIEWSTELMDYGQGWGHVRYFNIAYIAPAAVTLSLFFSDWPTINITDKLPPTPSQLYPVKTFLQCPPNKSKLVGFTLSSTQPWRCFKQQLEVWYGSWNRTSPYERIRPFGGPADSGALV